jgi:hypothetical protein
MPNWTTTIKDIKDFHGHVFSNGSQFIPNHDPLSTHDKIICFSDEIPTLWQYNFGLDYQYPLFPRDGNPMILQGMIIQKVPEPRTSRVVKNQARTGKYSYHLSNKKKGIDPAQKSPVRPVKIAPIGE